MFEKLTLTTLSKVAQLIPATLLGEGRAAPEKNPFTASKYGLIGAVLLEARCEPQTKTFHPLRIKPELALGGKGFDFERLGSGSS